MRIKWKGTSSNIHEGDHVKITKGIRAAENEIIAVELENISREERYRSKFFGSMMRGKVKLASPIAGHVKKLKINRNTCFELE